MEAATIVFQQVLIMFALMFAGFLMTKCHVISQDIVRGLCKVLLFAVIPSAIINAYAIPYDAERSTQLLLAFGIAIGFHLVAAVVALVLFRKQKSQQHYKMHRLALVYSNAGFMGFPLLTAMFGDIGIFLGSAYIAVFNIFVWIHGIKTLKEHEKIGVKKILLNPGVIAVVVGLLTYFLRITYPLPIRESIRFLGSMNTPLAMLVIGGFCATVSFQDLLKEVKPYLVSIARLILMPLLLIGALLLFRVSNWSSSLQVVALAMIISAACPAAAIIVILPESIGIDAREGNKVLVISTVLSLLTLPLFTMLGQWVM